MSSWRSLSTASAGQQENEATEALTHVLRTSRQAREAFTAVLAASDPTGAPLPEVAEVRTQQRSADTQAQTDLELVDDAGVVRAIVEVKLEAGLHGDQLTSYIEVFGDGGGATRAPGPIGAARLGRGCRAPPAAGPADCPRARLQLTEQ